MKAITHHALGICAKGYSSVQLAVPSRFLSPPSLCYDFDMVLTGLTLQQMSPLTTSKNPFQHN